MSFLKINKGKLNTAITNIDNYISNIQSFKEAVSNFLSSECNITASQIRHTESIDANGDGIYDTKIEEKSYDYGGYYNNFVNGKNRCNDALSKIDDKVISPLTKIKEAFDEVNKLMETFDGKIASLKDFLEGYNDSKKSGEVEQSYFYVEEIENVDGTTSEQLRFTWVDAEGNTYDITIAEMVNAFYTEVGMTMNSMVVAGMFAAVNGAVEYDENGNPILSVEQQKNVLSSTSSMVDNALAVHAFGVASQADIEAVVANAESKGYAIYDIKDIEKSIDGYDQLGSETLISAASGVGMFALGAYSLTGYLDKFGGTKIEDEEEKENTSIKTEGKEEGKDKHWSELESNSGSGGSFEGGGHTGSGTSEGTGNSSGVSNKPANSENSTDDGNDSSNDDNDTVVDEKPDIDMVEVTESDVPENMEEVELTPEEIDEMAKDKYYSQFESDDAFRESRAEDLSEFNELYNQEDKSRLIEEFKEMGYNEDEIQTILTDEDIASNAYLLGKQNQETAKLAIEIAEKNNIDNFDTVYDDKPDYNDLTDGTSIAELTNIYENADIKAAKISYDEAQNNYVAAVNTANDSIEAANAAEDNMRKVLSEVQKESGADICDWTPEQIEKVNKATSEYNKAVEQANTDYESAKSLKATYDESKEKFFEQRDKYYNEIKENHKDDFNLDSSNNIQDGNVTNTDENFSDDVFIEIL